VERLVGQGTTDNPDVEIHWREHKFGHVFNRINPRVDLVVAQISSVLSLWPIIDLMLYRLYGDMSDTERLDWYKQHADDKVYIRVNSYAVVRSVWKWSDALQFRSFEEVIGSVGPQLPPSQWH